MDDSIGTVRGVLKRRKVCKGGFTVGKQTRFLDALALTCNIRMSAAHAGVHQSSCYQKRARDAVFAARMKTAFAIGLDRLELLVLEHGGAGVAIDPDPDRAEAHKSEPGQGTPDQGGPGQGGPDQGVPGKGEYGDAPPPFDFDRAMRVLTYHRATLVKSNTPNGRPPINATREDTNAALTKALAAAGKRLAKVALKLEGGLKLDGGLKLEGES